MALIKKFRIENYRSTEPIVELKNISVFYNKRQIIDNLNLQINKEEILGMLGPNGVGKSTIFNLITGLKDPNYGEIYIDGIKSTKLPINERFTKFKLGFVPQYGGLIQDLSLLENSDQKNGNIVSVKNLRSTKSMAAIAKQALESHTSLPHDCSFVIGR